MNRTRWITAGLLVLLGLGTVATVHALTSLSAMGCFALAEDVVAVRIPPPHDGVIRFVALGDTGTGTPAQRKVANAAHRVCQAQGCDFITLLGDNFYEDGLGPGDEEKFRKLVTVPYGKFGIPILPVLGNHDLRAGPTHQVLATLTDPHWTMPNFRYAFEAGPARFLATNSNCAPLEWLHLAGQLRSTWDGWTVVLSHHPLHGTSGHGDSPAWSEEFWDWLVEDDVDLVLSGHNHVLELLEEPSLRPLYVISGSAGGARLGADDRAHLPSEATSLFHSERRGFAWIAISREALRIVFYNANAEPLFTHQKLRPS